MRHSIPAALCLIVLSCGLSGCKPRSDELRPTLGPPEVNGLPTTPVSEAPPAPGGTQRALVIRHRIITLQLPLGAASETEELWTYINEEPVGARRGPCLFRNSIRVGIGREADWPEVARTLRRLTGEQLSRSQVVAQPGRPVPIALLPGRGEQTIFMFRPDGTLFGMDYPPGDNLMVITAGVNFDGPRNVLLRGAPVIRTKKRTKRYVKGETGYVLRAEPIYFRMEELAFQFNVPPGGFVMMGPGPEVKRPTSPGRKFLTAERRGERFETIMVIAPEVFVAPVRRTGATAAPTD